ncbi:MAG: tail fiber protein [Pseudomonadota bacterium]
MTLYKWSQTASADANADSTINWAEGQSPSSVNDSARAMMAATAKYRDDIAGAIVTGGTSTAYTVSSYEVFDTLAHLNGQMIAFTPHLTNGATVTLNVDGLGAKPLRSAPGVELSAGTLIQGTPYIALYNHASAAFHLHGFFGNPYNVPLAAGLDYWAATTPNSAFAFPAGQPISRTTYAALFSLIGTTYGAGDGSTTFNLPNKAGRVSVMKEASATLLTPTYFGANSANLGATGGSESHQVTTSQMPSHQHDVFLKDPGHLHAFNAMNGSGGVFIQSGGGYTYLGAGNTDTKMTGITVGSVNGTANDNKVAATGGGSPHNNVQPTIVCNYIIRVL